MHPLPGGQATVTKRRGKSTSTDSTLVIFCGDLHVGSTTAVAPKAHCQNAEMERLLALWLAFVERAKAAAKGRRLVLCLGGDLVDGPRHHGNWQTWGTALEQRDAAVVLLQPLANIASEVMSIYGTEVHAGGNGQDDEAVARELGAKKTAYAWRMTIDGVRVFWSHHGLAVARDPWNAANGMFAMAKRLAWRDDPPQLAVFHHVHQMPAPVTAYGVTVAAVGCWQSQTAHGYKFRAERGTDIGALAWEPGKVPEPWPCHKQDDYEEIKPRR